MKHDIARPVMVGRSIRGHTVLTISGELDIATTAVLRDRITAVLNDGTKPVIVDLSLVSFCDASGLSLLIALRRRADLRGRTVALAAPRASMRKLLRVTGLDRSFPVHATLAHALAGPVAARGHAVA
jgi:anti-anti-sigma factor